MIKKFLLSTVLLLIPIITFASDNHSFAIGNKFYDSLEDALFNVKDGETIELFSSATLKETFQIDKNITIDLNGNNIEAPSTSFLVKGGNLTITGQGTIKEQNPYHGAIRVMGNTSNTNEKYSILNVGKDVTLEGWSGVFVTHTSGKSYGVSINLDGTIKASSDTSGDSGIGVYVNGTIQHEDNHPVININDNAKIYSNGTGLYIAGYSTFNIKDAYIEGEESGIGIKSGKLNIDGATIICNGKDTTPTEGYNNGVKSSGTAIQIESNNGYAGNMEIDISSGNITSKNSSVIYEYIGKGSATQVKSLSISGGKLVSEANKNVFLFSNTFKDTHSGFISGGKYSSNPSDYLKSGYSANLDNNLYQVSKSSMAAFKESASTNNFSLIITMFIIISTVTILFLNRVKLIKVFKNVFSK